MSHISQYGKKDKREPNLFRLYMYITYNTACGGNIFVTAEIIDTFFHLLVQGHYLKMIWNLCRAVSGPFASGALRES